MQSNRFMNFLLSHKAMVIFAILASVILLILSNFGFISVEVQTAGTGELTYTITNQNNNKTIGVKTNSSSFTRLVRKATYEVTVSQQNKNAFAVTNTSGFLTKKTATVVLAPERARQFVGNNPEPCMYYVGGVLNSYACSGAISSNIHVPATQILATYIQKNPNSVFKFGEVEGVVHTKQGLLAMVRISEVDSVENHIVFTLPNAKNINDGVALSGLNAEERYSIEAYRDGILVYNQAFSEVFYYASISKSKEPERINLDKPVDQNLRPLSISIYGRSILATYSEHQEDEITDTPGAQTAKTKAELVLYESSEMKRFTITDNFSTVMLCGNYKVCLLGEKLKIYDISDSKPKLSFMVLGVDNILNSTKGLLVFRDQDILNIDVDKQSGSIDYTFGDYQYCGAQPDIDGYLLCLIDNKNKKVALRINQQESDIDSIDKKVLELQKLPEVLSVSAYGRYVFISPDAGRLVYNPSINGFDYDPVAKKTANDKINQEVARLGIDTTAYTIINTKK